MQKYSEASLKFVDYYSTAGREQKKIDFIRKNEAFAATDFELLISDISSRMARCGWEDLDSAIEANIKSVLDFLHLDRAVLLQQEEGGSKRFACTHIIVASGHGHLDEKPFFATDSFPWMFEQLLSGHEFRHSRIDDLPEAAIIDKETLRKFGPDHFLLAFPLFDDDRIYGIFALTAAKEIVSAEKIMPLMNVAAHVFSSSILLRRKAQKLDQCLLELEKLKKQKTDDDAHSGSELKASSPARKIICQSPAIREAFSKAEQVAATNATVLFHGETGTGKEVFASMIHRMSPRGLKPMVRVNCGAIPAALVESEMFGREKGAYTGALSRQIGRFELADTSTIFLDEITSLPMEAQVKLLRVLQEREIERLGNPKPIHIDVRVIAATNQSLEKAVQDGTFRKDLYYRLNVFPIHVPSLRERREDIPMLVWTFVEELCNELGKKVESISQKCMEALIEYSWPGNVRELRNAIERAMIISNSSKLEIEIPKVTSSNGTSTAFTLKEMEIQHIRRVLENASWKIRGKQGAADTLGMKPTTLETRMAKLGIKRP